MTSESVSFAVVLRNVSSSLQWQGGAARELRRNEAAALRELAKLVEWAEEIVKAGGVTSGNLSEATVLVHALAAGFMPDSEPEKLSP